MSDAQNMKALGNEMQEWNQGRAEPFAEEYTCG